MALREKINESKALSFGVVIVLLAVAGGILYLTFKPETKMTMDQDYFTIDDGQSWFLDDMWSVPPYKHDGKDALGAAMYEYPDGKLYPGYLWKYDDDMKKKMDDAMAQAKKENRPPQSITLFSPALDHSKLIKLPGAGHPWMVMSSDEGIKLIGDVKSPKGDPPVKHYELKPQH